MLLKLFDAVSIKLNQVFGDGFRIYGDEDLKQGLEEPCFFIAVLNPSQEQLLGTRFSREYPVDIHFFPQVEGSNTELFGVAEKMLAEMNLVTLVNGDVVRGFKLHYEIVDGVLHFFVTYKVVVLIADLPEDDMETIDVTTNTWKG